MTAILNHSKIGNKINQDALTRLFEDTVTKRLKTEGGLNAEKAEELEGDFGREQTPPNSLGMGLARSARIEIRESERGNMTAEQNDADDLLSSLKLNFSRN